jgi:hypothetical protein
MLHKYAWDDLDPANPEEVDRFVFREEAPHVDPAVMERLKKEKLGKIGNFTIYMVNGEFVRNNIDIDYTTGGNFARDTYIPIGEIWVSDSAKPSDYGPVLIHECIETYLMTKLDVEYDNAHDFANLFESKLRREIVAKKIKIKTNKDAFREANKVWKKFLDDSVVPLGGSK